MGVQRLLHFNGKCRRRTPAIAVQLDQSYLYVGGFVLKHPRVVVTPGWYGVCSTSGRTDDKQEINSKIQNNGVYEAGQSTPGVLEPLGLKRGNIPDEPLCFECMVAVFVS